jgi:hypothetical protein
VAKFSQLFYFQLLKVGGSRAGRVIALQLPAARGGFTVTVHFNSCNQLTCPARSAQIIEPAQPDATRPAASGQINRFRRNPNHRYHLARPPRHEGRIAIVTDAGLDAVDAAASGAIVVAGRVLRERFDVSADDRRFKAFATPAHRHLAGRRGGEGAAYGEVVWFWHPMLMSKPAETRRPDRAQDKSQSAGDGGKQEIRRRGEHV